MISCEYIVIHILFGGSLDGWSEETSCDSEPSKDTTG